MDAFPSAKTLSIFSVVAVKFYFLDFGRKFITMLTREINISPHGDKEKSPLVILLQFGITIIIRGTDRAVTDSLQIKPDFIRNELCGGAKR